MNPNTKAGLVGLTVAMLIPSAWAFDIGDPAPELQVGTWVKQGPVEPSALKGKTVVLEFWATWCGPCLQNIPHLTELQKKYKDKGVVIVGITDEPASVVKPFVERMGDKMGYAVAIDKRQATHRAYMGAFNVQGIPYSFVIDKSGALAWHGHPQAGLDRVIERIAEGKFNIKQARQEAAATKAMEQYLELLGQVNAAREEAQRTQLVNKAQKTGDSILELAAQSPELLNDFALTILLMPGTEYRDLKLAGRAAEAAFKASEQKPADKARKLMQDYFRSVQGLQRDQSPSQQQQQQLNEISSQIMAQADPEALNQFAWAIMMAPELRHRDLKLALKSAEAAVNATKGQDASALDTYARALFENGQRDKAVEYARKAVEVNQDEQLEPILKQSLEQYSQATQGQTGATR